MAPASPLPDLIVIVPMYNEAAVLRPFWNRLSAVLDGLGGDARALFVDDGSNDDSASIVAELAAVDRRVGLIRLARNFGKEAAMAAAIDHADARVVAVIDADLQDPPELIARFLDKLAEGYDMVYGIRASRTGISWLKRFTAASFYRLIDRMSRTRIPRDVGDFRVMTRRTVLALRRLKERQRFMKGLFAWVGFRQIGVPYHAEPRVAGSTKFNYWKLWNFALDGITGFSTVPLRMATYVGGFTALVAFIYGTAIIGKTLLYGEAVRGYPSLMTVMLFLGGVQLIALGIIGEYLGRLFEEAKQRPLYLEQERVGWLPQLDPED